jgi:putative ABC transport system permease protein
VGIISANQARTINRNIEDKIHYEIGADINIRPEWKKSNDDAQASVPMGMPVDNSTSLNVNTTKQSYIEPPFGKYEDLEGIESIAKVSLVENVQFSAYTDKANSSGAIMAIDTYQFGKTAWFRDDLLPFHINQYINLMQHSQKAILASSVFRDSYGLKTGDEISMFVSGAGLVDGIIYAFIDYWPGYNTKQRSESGEIQPCVVMNLSYFQDQLTTFPYDIWIKKDKEHTDTDMNQILTASGLKITNMNYADQEIIKMKNDPFHKGMNGMLTLGFIVTMLVATIGFLIYWILSIKERTLQFGIFRAIGLRKRDVISIIILEQVLLSCTSVLVGIIIGGIASDIFVPLIQIVTSASGQVPPFQVVASRQDYYKIYILVLFMLTLGISILSRIIGKIKIDQALKLGED